MNLIKEHLATLPKKNTTHAHYMREIQVERDDASKWLEDETPKLIPDTLEYPKKSPFISLTGFLP